MALCFAPWNFRGLCWLALTPLICAVWFAPKSSPIRQALLGWVAGICFFTTTFHWLGALGDLYAAPILRAIPLLLSLYLGLYFAAWGLLLGQFSSGKPGSFLRSGRNLGMALTGAAAWTVLEWVRGWLFSGFGWNGLGVALHAELALIQICEFTGVLGVSFIVAFANLLAVIVLRRLCAEIGPGFLSRVRWEFSLGVALVASVFAYGVGQLLGPPGPALSSSTKLRVATLQPNIPQEEKFSEDSEEKILQTLDHLSGLGAAARPDLVLWPESATPRGLFSDQNTFDFVREQAARGDFGLLLGSVEDAPAESKTFNGATLFTQRGEHIQKYRKIHLVPFGEYLPLRHSIPLLNRIAGHLIPGDFSSGTDFSVLHLEHPSLPISPLICFEDSVGEVARGFAKNGSRLLVNLTNDGWFAQTAAAEQHLANAIFRAVENRRPLVRCANTGVSCSVSPTGNVDRWIHPFSQGIAVREILVPDTPPLTFYSRHGDWWAYGCGVGSVLGCLFLRRRR